MSSSFRFHCAAAIVPNETKVLLRKRKPISSGGLIYLAADARTITDIAGTRSILAFQDLEDARYATLTRREADLVALANPGKRPPVALENIHPWLPLQYFRDDSAENFSALMAVIRQFGRQLVYAGAFCDEKWNTICNSIRMKTDHDLRFYAAWHLPIQDAYVLEERRPGRSVIALDFNSMYPACMQQLLPNPSSMRHIDFNRDLSPDEILPMGLFRCILDGSISDFIRKYNPFRSFFAGRHLRAAIGEPLLVDLNEFEIDFFRKHFGRIYVFDAVTSDDHIAHPLAREARRSFARRKHLGGQGNKALADREKFLSTLLSSCAHRPARSRRAFGSGEAADEYLRINFGIGPKEDEPAGASCAWQNGRKGLIVSGTNNGVSIDVPNLRDGSACFVLNQRTVARGRILLLEMMEKLIVIAPDVELCYANIDSIHFSLPTPHLAQVMELLKAEASDEMGSFKIEAVTRNGLWLEPGQYWLYSDSVEKFRNRSVGNRILPFADHAIHVASRKLGELHVPIRITLRMEKTMSDARTITDDNCAGIARQQLVEIGEQTLFTDVLELLENNQRLSAPRRMQAFRDLQTNLETAASLSLGTR